MLANVLVAQAARALRGGRAAAGHRPELPRRHARRGRQTAIWPDIYLANADALVAAIDDAIARLSAVRDALAARDARRGRAPGTTPPATDRRRLLEADLAGGAVRELRVAVPNRPGVVAEIALALGRGA